MHDYIITTMKKLAFCFTHPTSVLLIFDQFPPLPFILITFIFRENFPTHFN